MAKEFLDSSARINYTKENLVSQGSIFTTRLNRFALRTLGSLGLAFSPLIIACSPDAKAVSPVSLPNQDNNRPAATEVTKSPEASATLAPGIGGVNPLPTYPKDNPNSELNDLIDRFNRGDKLTTEELNRINAAKAAEALGTATAGNLPKEAPTPEVKKESISGILSPEAEATAQLLHSIDQDGNVFEVIGFILEPDEVIKAPKAIQIAKSPIQQPSKYHGNQLFGYFKDGSGSLQIRGDLEPVNPEKKTEDFGQSALMATMKKTKVPVFDGFPYDLTIGIGDVASRRKMFPQIVNQAPVVIPYKISGTPAEQPSAKFFDIPIPQPRG